jgi:hypothetical protein
MKNIRALNSAFTHQTTLFKDRLHKNLPKELLGLWKLEKTVIVGMEEVDWRKTTKHKCDSKFELERKFKAKVMGKRKNRVQWQACKPLYEIEKQTLLSSWDFREIITTVWLACHCLITEKISLIFDFSTTRDLFGII